MVADADKDLKFPAWLNDPTLYHNRGNSTWAGESVTYGDFDGLDDLMTEHPTVVDGFVDVYQDWIDLGIDGFRIDTAKHVNFEFWEDWSTQVLDYAHAKGKLDFFMFGEVYDADPVKLSPYVRDTDMNSVLDFTFQSAAQSFASGGSAKTLQALFAGDDHYTTPDTSATALPTFLGNHDMGRIGYFLRDSGAVLERDELAHDLLFLSRGQPVVYYGDEQGFAGVGDGKDKNSRQTLFASQVAEYQNQTLVTGETMGAADHYATDAPVYQHIAALSQLREDHPALVTGAQIERYATTGPGVYAFSRVDRAEKVEYLVAVNNATTAKSVDLDTLTASASFHAGLWRRRCGDDRRVRRGIHHRPSPFRRRVACRQDGLGARGSRSDHRHGPCAGRRPGRLRRRLGRCRRLDLAGDELRVAHRRLGRVDRSRHRRRHRSARVPRHPRPRERHAVEYRAVSTDAAGHRSAASTYASVGDAVSLDVARGSGGT